jgi:hypothetical protein
MNDWIRPGPDPNQLALIPEPVEHLGPEPPPPPPGPIREAQAYAEQEGWIPEGSLSCLYVSAGMDTRPLTYLRPEVIPEEVVADWVLPRFFVFVDRDQPADGDDLSLEFDDGRTRVETIEERTVDSETRDMAALLRIRLRSDRFPVREYAVLRICGDNEAICQESLSEGWAPDWFIGVRDGCGGCFNIIDSPERSIPLRLGVSFWLTNDLGGYGLTDDHFNRLHGFGHSIPVPGGQRLLEVAAWRTWPSSGWGIDRWVSLFQLEDARTTPRPSQAS